MSHALKGGALVKAEVPNGETDPLHIAASLPDGTRPIHAPHLKCERCPRQNVCHWVVKKNARKVRAFVEPAIRLAGIKKPDAGSRSGRIRLRAYYSMATLVFRIGFNQKWHDAVLVFDQLLVQLLAGIRHRYFRQHTQ